MVNQILLAIGVSLLMQNTNTGEKSNDKHYPVIEKMVAIMPASKVAITQSVIRDYSYGKNNSHSVLQKRSTSKSKSERTKGPFPNR